MRLIAEYKFVRMRLMAEYSIVRMRLVIFDRTLLQLF